MQPPMGLRQRLAVLLTLGCVAAAPLYAADPPPPPPPPPVVKAHPVVSATPKAPRRKHTRRPKQKRLPPRPFAQGELSPVIQNLVQDGLRREVVTAALEDPRLRKSPFSLSLNIVYQGGDHRYRQFYNKSALRLAESFKKQHADILAQAEARYQVPSDVIVAVLLVETRFGTFPMRHRALEVFSTMALARQEAMIDEQYQQLYRRSKTVTREQVAERMGRKADWAYQELFYLFVLAEKTGQNPYDMKGSYAGALGMPQFLPSSYLRWGVDADQDGRVDLNTLPDAVLSVGNYLHQHGWKPNAELPELEKAVWAYNNSTSYVNAIFQVSRRMGRVPSSSPPILTLTIP
ncbi:MAG: lytic murein transglycosylase [Deltaproteobacteria bacterium]|nr:lytic murein transglycosylase [Deltaproteobacteria bacterium]